MLPGSFFQEKEPDYRLHTMWIFTKTTYSESQPPTYMLSIMYCHLRLQTCTATIKTRMNAGGTKTQQHKHRYLIEELLIHNADIPAM